MLKRETGINEETLPFEERITIESWNHRNLDIEAYRTMHRSTLTPEFWETVANEIDWFKKMGVP